MYIDEQSQEVNASWANLLRKKYPCTSFPKRLDNAFLANSGIYPVKPAKRLLNVEYISHKPQNINGVWTEVLEVK
jgi:hypothetical protein